MSTLHELIKYGSFFGGKGSDGSGGGTQPDWNQNDPTKADYVKNRPFWTDDPKETVLLDGTVHLVGGCSDEAQPFAIEVGVSYKVTFDGGVYEFVGVQDEDGCAYIGNPGLWTGDNDDGTPIAVGSDCTDPSCSWICAHVEDDGDYELKIEGVVGEVHKIDNKYLDRSYINDMYNLIWEIEETARRNNSFKLGVGIQWSWNMSDANVGWSWQYNLEPNCCKLHWAWSGVYVETEDLVLAPGEFGGTLWVEVGLSHKDGEGLRGFYATNYGTTSNGTYNYRLNGIIILDGYVYTVRIVCTDEETATLTITRIA